MQDYTDISDLIKNYILTNNVFVCIMTPSYTGSCDVNYVTSLIETIKVFNNYGIKFETIYCKDSVIARARNNLIAIAMSNTNVTHMLFIDNNISWNPLDVLKLLISNKNIVGGVYPVKPYNWNLLLEENKINKWLEEKNKSKIMETITDEDYIRYKMIDYNISFLDNEKDFKIEHNLARVKYLPSGFMLFKRNVIEKMIKAFPSTKYTDDMHFLKENQNEYAYALFDCGVEDNQYITSDVMFSKRWSKMGGSLWVDVSINLNQNGLEEYKGSFLTSVLP